MAAPLVDWHIGRMPLVITCPHDGRAEPPGVPERPNDQAGCLTKKQADLSTRTIALGLSSAVQALMGLEPSMVVARFHRRYIDANRPERCAFVAREARPLYREYHNRITAAIRSTVKQFPRLGILVDIHGAADLSKEPDTHVLLGTDGGESIARLLELDTQDPIPPPRAGSISPVRWIRSDSGERRRSGACELRRWVHRPAPRRLTRIGHRCPADRGRSEGASERGPARRADPDAGARVGPPARATEDSRRDERQIDRSRFRRVTKT